MFPYWHQAPKQPQRLDLNLYTRIGYLGAILEDPRRDNPVTYLAPAAGALREAERHGNKVDLVVYRRDWAWLADVPVGRQGDVRMDELAGSVARELLKAADRPLADLDTRLEALLWLPSWRGSPYAYHGLTLFFDAVPTDEGLQAQFTRFLNKLMDALIEDRKQRHRAFNINLVVPEQQVGAKGPYAFEQLLYYVEQANPKRTTKTEVEARKAGVYRVGTEITVDYLVLLGEPTKQRKKELRARFDNTEIVQGHSRIALLDSVMPLLLHPRGEAVAKLPEASDTQLDNDLAYMKWNFGGVSLWPLPVSTLGMGGSVLQRLGENFGDASKAAWPWCPWVCSHRLEERLALQTLVLACALTLGLWRWNCRVRTLGRPYKRLGIGLAGLALLLGLLMVSCDPSTLETARKNLLLLAVVVIGVFAVGVQQVLKSKEPAP